MLQRKKSNLQKVKNDLIQIGKDLYQRNMLAAADGNFSHRLDHQRILITASGVTKGRLTQNDFALMTLDHQVVQGRPSSEGPMHLTIYEHCPQAKYVLHAHPPTAIAWTIARPDLQELPTECMSEVILAMGRVPIIPYARPGTQDMGNQLIPYLPHCKSMILARHGALSWGESLQEALNGMERMEHVAQILLSAVKIGGITNLPAEEIQYLWHVREKMGNYTL